ncbi:MAG TPA: TRAP transporter substrate-binding protein DctP [Chitinivibrionales bacterium]|nr:TRAP transporter substrate-binding protein DctP [Chitinivibrionales bacterium]
MNARMLCCAFFSACLFSASAASVTIKLGSLAPGGSPWDKGLQRLGAEWEKISFGAVELRIYPGGIAGDEADMIRKMRIGQLNAAGLTGIGLSRIFPEIITVQLPLFIRGNDELDYVLDKMKPVFAAELEKRGFKVLIWSFVGWVHFFSRNPVVTPDDLKAQKMFVWSGDPDAVMVWKESGFHVVPLTPPDIMTSLQSGMIDAFSATALSAASYQWFGIAKNMCAMKWAPLIGGIVVSANAWAKLDPALAARLDSAAQKVGADMQADILKADDEAVTVMKKYGLAVNPVPQAAEDAWRAAVQGGFEKGYLKNIDKGLLDAVRKYSEEYRAKKGK